MKIRNRIMICLVIIGIGFYLIGYGVIIPKNNQNKAEYIENQKNPITHDLDSILKYKNKYMGNVMNISQLFGTLPLNDIPMSFESFPDKLTVEVNYKVNAENINKDKLDKSLIYNSIAAFALIDNLEGINYNFTDSTYKFLRSDIEELVDEELSSLLVKDKWKLELQDKLENDEYPEIVPYRISKST